MRVILYMLLLLLCVVSCQTAHTTVTETARTTDTFVVHKVDTFILIKTNEIVRDSIVHDSTIITLSTNGDTIRQVIYRDRFIKNNIDKSETTDKKTTRLTAEKSTATSQNTTEVTPKDTKRHRIVLGSALLFICVLSIYKIFKLLNK